MWLKWRWGLGWGNNRDQRCWALGHPISMTHPQTPACAYQGTQGFKAGLEEHSGDGLTSKHTPWLSLA